MEIEVRLVGPAKVMGSLARAAALRTLALGDQATQQLETTYWDTPALDFRRAGVALRVRTRDAGTPVLSCKADSGHPLARHEIEVPLEAERPDLGLLVAAGWSPHKGLLKRADALQPVFASKVTRRARRVTFADGTVAELAFDSGEICSINAAPVAEPVRELEIELVEGDVRRVYELAIALVGEFPDLRLLFASKAERAARLVAPGPAPARRAQDITATAKASAGTLAVDAAGEALAQVAANVEGAKAGADDAYVHQLRVGLRRYRLALALAKTAGLPQPSQALRGELESLWGVLGRMRDWDVFERETWPALRASAPAAEVPSVDATLTHERRARVAALRAVLDGTRFQESLLVALWALENQREHVRAEPGKGAKAFARRVLKKHHKRVQRRGENLARLDAAGRHRLRIDAKKLRYTAEFCASLFARSKVKPFLRRLGELQATLGTLHDLEAVLDTLSNTPVTWPPEARQAIRSSWNTQAPKAAKRLAGRLARDWRRFDQVKPFWK